MHVLQSIGLFVIAALAEIGGAWLVWQGVFWQRGVVFIGLGIMALAAGTALIDVVGSTIEPTLK